MKLDYHILHSQFSLLVSLSDLLSSLSVSGHSSQCRSTPVASSLFTFS